MWSLGCVLYYLCNLHPPFQGDNLIQLGQNICNKQPRPLNPHYSKRMRALIAALLTKDPAQRPAITDVQAMLRSSEVHVPVTSDKSVRTECALSTRIATDTRPVRCIRRTRKTHNPPPIP